MKIEEQVLSREQMAHLKELGVDTSDASMMWVSYKGKIGTDCRYLMINNDMSREIARVMSGVISTFVPTYTIGDLIEKLPKEIDGRKIIIDFKRGAIGYLDFQILLLQDFELGTILRRMYHLLCWVAKNQKELIK